MAPERAAAAGGEEITVEITGLAPGGDAVGRQVGGAGEGRVTFVALAAPGERVRARVTRVQRRVAWAELLQIERASDLRVAPPCPLFGRCGGCQWQHVQAAEQRRAKGGFVSRALGREVGEARAVGPDYGYRERARLTVARDEGGGRAVGFLARRSHQVIDVPACLLLAAPLARALPVVRALAASAGHGESIPVQGGGVASTGDAPVEAGPAGQGEVAWRLGGRLLRLPPGQGPATPEQVEAHDAGDPGAWPDLAEPGDAPLRVPPGAFSQVGRAANRALLAAVAQAVGPDPGRVLELHAGSGNFTRVLVQRSARVTASDGDAAAVSRGRLNVPAARWVRADALTAEPFDTVLADPPREGLDARHLAVAAGARQRLVYVSCDPQTLGRDARLLGARGWRLAEAQALDLQPQTHHVEVVAVFVPAVATAPDM
jgi:23S rRNA (uracil1939-C5)-methyltransferase